MQLQQLHKAEYAITYYHITLLYLKHHAYDMKEPRSNG